MDNSKHLSQIDQIPIDELIDWLVAKKNNSDTMIKIDYGYPGDTDASIETYAPTIFVGENIDEYTDNLRKQ